ncbi:hypothetical protein JHK87_048479 [Glycine soja]|nr:hypothetical protein JHK87_048479 [Glycine soja]
MEWNHGPIPHCPNEARLLKREFQALNTGVGYPHAKIGFIQAEMRGTLRQTRAGVVRVPPSTTVRTQAAFWCVSEVIKPKINGVLDIMKACLKAKTVRRLIFTSSAGTLNANEPQKPVFDETC